ncbi:MAG: cation:proton antiporter [Puniceicoccales bacterium]|jgi:CPA2 family monovalent cation:H+ antiporter-2|nr:cation:proton antiporter [Puniceicoccales bacterium]
MPTTLIKDIAFVLLAAGAAGLLCKRLGLSVIVGYLLAGILIGPNMPLHLITDEARIEDLAQVGLVFVMFAIGLHLSLSKLARMGLPTIFATALITVFMIALTLLLGVAMGWTYYQSIFLAAMVMVSSSAVVSKILQELHLTHDKTAQTALAITVVEDIVAVVMLAVLGTVSIVAPGTGDTAIAIPDMESVMSKAVEGIGGIGGVFTKVSSYVILVLALCLLFVPRLLKRLDTSGDPELRNVGIAGLLLVLAFFAEQAGFSPALGAFLFGAIVAELPQKEVIAKSFESVHSIFSSLFFVSIGMMANPVSLLDWKVSGLAIVLVLFAMIGRPLACGFALMLSGVPLREARRGGLLLTPLGELTFVFAQAAIAKGIFEESLYPVAIALSVFTVLLTPIVNRFADPILRIADKVEPRFLTRTLEAYHDWITAVQNSTPRPAWKLARPRLLQIAAEVLLVTGIFAFSKPVLGLFSTLTTKAATRGGPAFEWLKSGVVVETIFWVGVGLVVLMFCVSLLRNIVPVSALLARSFSGPLLPRSLLENGFRAVAAVLLLGWLFVILPQGRYSEMLPVRLVLIAAAGVFGLVFSRRLVNWHSAWRSTVEDVFTSGNAKPETVETARRAISGDLEPWDIQLQDCLIPEDAACAGVVLSALSIPSNFGASIMEIERNGYKILSPGPETRLYPGDTALLLGRTEEIEKARAFLGVKTKTTADSDVTSHAVLETFMVGDSPRLGRTFAELGIAKNTGVRIAGIQREGQRIVNPSGTEVLKKGDGLLLMGTPNQTRAFAKWLQIA